MCVLCPSKAAGEAHEREAAGPPEDDREHPGRVEGGAAEDYRGGEEDQAVQQEEGQTAASWGKVREVAMAQLWWSWWIELKCYIDNWWVGPSSMEDQEFVQQSTEAELVQLFRVYDELCEQRQEMENKLDETEDLQLP